jgi:hypothetical protein
MTNDERQALINSASDAIRRLVPKRLRPELEEHLAVMLVAANEQAAEWYRRGMLAVEVRVDRRDLGFIDDDTATLKSVH